MLNRFFLAISAAALLVLTSCSGKLGALSADNFNVDPTPLATQAGQVPVTINGTFPEKYMKKKAVVTVTPELRATDGSLVVKGTPATFQGEKVLGNDQTISYLIGGRYNMRSSFPYADALHKSDLYLTFQAKVGKKTVNVPAVKVGHGVIATSELYRQAMEKDGGCLALDSFQRIRSEKLEASVKFLINQAQLRQSELKNNSVQEFVSLLKRINADKENLQLNNVEVKAYASPDGGQKFNDKLAAQRQSVSEKYVKEEMQKAKIKGEVASEYTAQDWDGFQRLVAASNIQDKDIILRVLSMYDDPEEREEQIKNMSAGFRELADGILPELRRSRMIINYESVGRSDEQIKDQYKSDPTKLSADELLYCATFDGTDLQTKENIYKAAVRQYPNDYRAYNNLACIAMAQGNEAKAKEYIDRALAVNYRAGEPQANLALQALKNGDLSAAEQYLSKATTAEGYKSALGALNVAKGNYAEAAANLKGTSSNMAALAQILNQDYEGAQKTFKTLSASADGLTDYIHAINNARLGNKYATNAYLKDAISKNSAWQQYADDDLEFSAFK